MEQLLKGSARQWVSRNPFATATFTGGIMDREMEATQLAEADRHVTRANRLVARQEEWIASHVDTPPRVLAQARYLLAAMRQTRQQLLDHRALIVQRLADVDRNGA